MCQIDLLPHMRKCDNQQEDLGINWRGKIIWLCSSCAKKILESDLEWGED